jgi:hypothetical protein
MERIDVGADPPPALAVGKGAVPGERTGREEGRKMRAVASRPLEDLPSFSAAWPTVVLSMFLLTNPVHSSASPTRVQVRRRVENVSVHINGQKGGGLARLATESDEV